MFFIFLLLIQSYRCANVQDLLDPTNTSIIFGSSFTDDQVSTLYKQIKKCGESAAPRNMKVKLYCCVPGIPADLPQHQPDQDRHGAGPDCRPLQPGQPLWEPLRRPQPGTFIQYMELGQTVLCNLDNLYESLYDALSQVPSYIQYMELGQTVVCCKPCKTCPGLQL